MKTSRKLLWLFATIVCLAACAAAQVQSAELHVTVKDAHGAVVRNATITVTDQARGLTRATKTNTDGEYVFLSLTPGVYTVTVEAPGFAKLVNQSVRLQIGHIEQLPLSLEVAAAAETVNVSSEAELVETQQSQSGTTISTTRIENLPINGRNYINFALTDSQLSRDDTPSIGAAPTSGLNVGGQRGRNNYVSVDGANSNDNSVNGVRSTISQDAVQEFQIITNGYSAEYGQAAAGVINIVSKSGTNLSNETHLRSNKAMFKSGGMHPWLKIRGKYKRARLKSKARRGNRAGFFIAQTRGTPKTPWFLGPHAPGDPKRKRFLSAAFPHPKPQNQQRSALEKPLRRERRTPCLLVGRRGREREQRQAAGGAHDCARQGAS